jgi:hypothetical protein
MCSSWRAEVRALAAALLSLGAVSALLYGFGSVLR